MIFYKSTYRQSLFFSIICLETHPRLARFARCGPRARPRPSISRSIAAFNKQKAASFMSWVASPPLSGMTGDSCYNEVQYLAQ